MKANEVWEIIKAEIGNDWSQINSHGVDLKKCFLTQPIRIKMEDTFGDGEARDFWLVLEETPGEKSGYLIVYDEERNRFGLAVSSLEELDVVISFYGTFLDTLFGM